VIYAIAIAAIGHGYLPTAPVAATDPATAGAIAGLYEFAPQEEAEAPELELAEA
jgi:hypothetical protein